MRYKLLGKSGLRVSELALGTMTFGADWGWGADQDTSKAIFDAYVDAGGNFIDTSCNYTNGTAEKFVGEFTKAQRDYFVLSTKYTLRNHAARSNDLNAGGNHRKNMVQTVEGSLKRLQTETVDMLILHIWDGTTPVDEILRAMDDLVRAGKVHYVGISDSPAWVTSYAVATAELHGWPRFITYQGEYNLLTRGAEREIFPMTRSLDMAFMAFGLLAGGQLTGKFNAGKPDEHTRIGKPEQRALEMAELVGEIAKEIGCSSAQVATNWVRQQALNIIPIIGTRRVHQIEDNLRALEFPLSEDHLKRLNEANALQSEYPDDFYKSAPTLRLAFGEAMRKLDIHRL